MVKASVYIEVNGKLLGYCEGSSKWYLIKSDKDDSIPVFSNCIPAYRGTEEKDVPSVYVSKRSEYYIALFNDELAITHATSINTRYANDEGGIHVLDYALSRLKPGHIVLDTVSDESENVIAYIYATNNGESVGFKYVPVSPRVPQNWVRNILRIGLYEGDITIHCHETISKEIEQGFANKKGFLVSIDPQSLLAETFVKAGAKCKYQNLGSWIEYKRSKSKKSMMTISLLVLVGLCSYFYAGYLENESDRLSTLLTRLSKEKDMVKSQIQENANAKLLSNWERAPSWGVSLASVVAGVGDGVRILDMKGNLTLDGKDAGIHVEGKAEALRGNLDLKNIKGMRINPVLIQGKVGVSFSYNKRLKKVGRYE